MNDIQMALYAYISKDRGQSTCTTIYSEVATQLGIDVLEVQDTLYAMVHVDNIIEEYSIGQSIYGFPLWRYCIKR